MHPGFRSALTVASASIWVVVLLAIGGAPAAAECSQFDPWPSFTDVAPAADRIAVVRVEEVTSTSGSATHPLPRSYRVATLRQIRGVSPAMFSIRDVRTHDPSRDCIGLTLVANVGDELALAFGAPHDHVAGPVSAVAFVGHGLQGRDDLNQIYHDPGMEILRLSDVLAFGSLPATATEPSASAPSSPDGWRIWVLAIAGLVGSSLWVVRLRRDAARHR